MYIIILFVSSIVGALVLPGGTRLTVVDYFAAGCLVGTFVGDLAVWHAYRFLVLSMSVSIFILYFGSHIHVGLGQVNAFLVCFMYMFSCTLCIFYLFSAPMHKV